jgi:DNA invertase Pin-like site-specific DNA recombinase
MNTKAVIYARVSGKDQDYSRQLADLKTYAAANSLELVGSFMEKTSGMNKASERPELTKVMELVTAGEIQHVIVTELSRFGRGAADSLTLIETLTANCCCLHIKDMNIKSLTADCKLDLMAEMLITVLAACNKMELNFIRNRMQSGYEHHRENGGKVGRLTGYKKPIDQVQYFSDIKRKLRAGDSIRKIQKLLIAENKKISLSTIVKVRTYLISENVITA